MPAPCAKDEELLRLAWAFARVWVELEAGRRAHHQLAPLASPRLRRRLQALPALPGPVGSVAKVLGTRTAPDRFDVVALVRRSPRAGAIAFRLACLQGAWTVVTFCRPEDGQCPAGHGPVGPELARPSLAR